MDFNELWHHISTFDEPVKAEFTNMIKYALAALPVVVAGVEGIRAVKNRHPEDPDREKSTGESLTTIVGMIIGILVVLFAADRFATYFVPDGDHRVVAHMVLFLLIADRSVGASVRNLMREWTGREGMGNLEEEKPPNQQAAIQHIQQHPQMAPRPPPTHQPPMNSNNLRAGGHQPGPTHMQQELNVMMAPEPMPASEFGGAGSVGSAW
jgi:hypothetical protein